MILTYHLSSTIWWHDCHIPCHFWNNNGDNRTPWDVYRKGITGQNTGCCLQCINYITVAPNYEFVEGFWWFVEFDSIQRRQGGPVPSQKFLSVMGPVGSMVEAGWTWMMGRVCGYFEETKTSHVCCWLGRGLVVYVIIIIGEGSMHLLVQGERVTNQRLILQVWCQHYLYVQSIV